MYGIFSELKNKIDLTVEDKEGIVRENNYYALNYLKEIGIS